MKQNETTLSEAFVGFAILVVLFLLAAFIESHHSLFY